MPVLAMLIRTGAGLGLTYTAVLIWTAAGIIGVIGLCLMLYGGHTVMSSGSGGRSPLRLRARMRRWFGR